jgi:hypothetical protein
MCVVVSMYNTKPYVLVTKNYGVTQVTKFPLCIGCVCMKPWSCVISMTYSLGLLAKPVCKVWPAWRCWKLCKMELCEFMPVLFERTHSLCSFCTLKVFFHGLRLFVCLNWIWFPNSHSSTTARRSSCGMFYYSEVNNRTLKRWILINFSLLPLS